MLVAVIGDNHGNALGLAEVVKDLRRRSPDVTVHLGDAFQGGTQPPSRRRCYETSDVR